MCRLQAVEAVSIVRVSSRWSDEMNCIIAFSACPQDMLPIHNGLTTEAHFEVWD
jgi:hypothetical protein